MGGVSLTGASSGVSAKTTIDHCRRDEWSPTNWCPRTLKLLLAKFNKKKTLRSTDNYASKFRTDPSSTLLCQHQRKNTSSRRVRAAGRDLKCTISRARRDQPTEPKPFRATCTLQIGASCSRTSPVDKMFKNSCSATGVGLIWL